MRNVIIAPMLTLEEVEHIAALARLTLTAEEKEHFRIQLSDILEYAARLQGLDTSHIPPTSSVLPSRSALRADEVEPGLDIHDILKNAPEIEKNQFRVPPALDLE